MKLENILQLSDTASTCDTDPAAKLSDKVQNFELIMDNTRCLEQNERQILLSKVTFRLYLPAIQRGVEISSLKSRCYSLM